MFENNIIKLKKFTKLKKKNLKNNKFYKINRSGRKYFNIINFKKNFKTERFYKNPYHFRQKYVLLNRKEYPFKNIKEINKMKFYLKENYFHPLEKEKLDYDQYYKKSFLLKTNLSKNQIKENLEINQKNNLIKTKKKKEKKLFFILNDLENSKLNLYSSKKKIIKNLYFFRKKLLKKLKNNFKKINFLNNYLQNRMILNSLTLKFTNVTKKNSLFFNNVNLNEKIEFNLNKIDLIKNFFRKNINDLFHKFFSFYFKKFHTLISKKKIITVYILNKFRQFIKNYIVENLLGSVKLKNFKNLSNLFFFTKKQSEFSYLLFENKPFFHKLELNVLKRKKNLQLKLLKEFYPDNIFEISKKKKQPIIYKLAKEGFKNFNDNESFLNFKKAKANSFLIQKKNLFFNDLNNLKDINFNLKKITFKHVLKLHKAARKIKVLKILKTYSYISENILLGKKKYSKLKRNKFKKKKPNRKLLKFVSFITKKKYRRQNLFLELSSINNVEIMKQDFEDGSKLL